MTRCGLPAPERVIVPLASVAGHPRSMSTESTAFDPRRCYLCGETAGVRCARCWRALCHGHRPADDRHRCTDCELEYARRGPSRLAAVLHAVLFVLALGGAWAFGRYLDREGYLLARGGDTIWAQFVVYCSLTALVVGCAGALVGIGKAIRRHRFLVEVTASADQPILKPAESSAFQRTLPTKPTSPDAAMKK